MHIFCTLRPGNHSDHSYQQPTHTLDQRRWLTEKYAIFAEHHDRKTLGQFFPSLYEEYFTLWPAIPTPENIEDAGGKDVERKTANAFAKIRKTEEQVCGFRVDQTTFILNTASADLPLDAQPYQIEAWCQRTRFIGRSEPYHGTAEEEGPGPDVC